jgi:hypothetical protein
MRHDAEQGTAFADQTHGPSACRPAVWRGVSRSPKGKVPDRYSYAWVDEAPIRSSAGRQHDVEGIRSIGCSASNELPRAQPRREAARRQVARVTRPAACLRASCRSGSMRPIGRATRGIGSRPRTLAGRRPCARERAGGSGTQYRRKRSSRMDAAVPKLDAYRAHALECLHEARSTEDSEGKQVYHRLAMLVDCSGASGRRRPADDAINATGGRGRGHQRKVRSRPPATTCSGDKWPYRPLVAALRSEMQIAPRTAGRSHSDTQAAAYSVDGS